jgi:hypothetical protein
VLIVEAFDRLSRASALDAQAELTQIINAGITVVTACISRQQAEWLGSKADYRVTASRCVGLRSAFSLAASATR